MSVLNLISILPYTRGSVRHDHPRTTAPSFPARAMNQPDVRGSIARGKKADFVLVDRDILTVSPEELKGTKAIWTMGNPNIV